jgi:tetratricopeptide (TPR) repeat protein
MSSRQDAALQDLIEDSIIRILEHEDPEQYLKWIRSAFPTYGLTPTDRARDEDAQRVMAMGIGRAIWNATPLPGNGFRPRPLPQPGRNDRCPCGSGKKHKKCCGLSGSLPDPQIDAEAILPLVLSLASPQQRGAMVTSQRLPITVLVEAAREYLEEGHPRKAVGFLEPIFADSIERPCFEHSLALHLLCQSYGELGHNRKELAVLERLAAAPAPSPLRGDARLALCDLRRAAGDVRSAREAWTLAKQDDPDMPGLGVCEIQLLVAEDRPEDALQRAAFWQKRLADRANAETERKLVDRLVDALQEVPRAIAAIDRLEDWFDDVRGRPIPRYAVTADAEDAITLEDRLRQMGLDEDQMRQAIESFEKSKAKNEQLGEPCAEPLPEPEDDAPMHELVPPGEVAALERKWHACFPDSKPFSTQDQPMGELRAFEPSHVEAWLGFLEANAAAACRGASLRTGQRCGRSYGCSSGTSWKTTTTRPSRWHASCSASTPRTTTASGPF